MEPSLSASRSEPMRRKLWRVDLNDVHVHDEAGHDYPVELTRGELDGPLTVTIVSQDVPLSVAEGLAQALERIYETIETMDPHVRAYQASQDIATEALAEFRAAYPKERASS